MTEPPKADGNEELCPNCKKPIKEHTPEQVMECTRKLQGDKDQAES